MSFNDCKISESEIQTTGVQAQADTLTGSAADNKRVFDALPTLVIQMLNSLIDQMQQNAAAGQIGVTPFDGMTAQTLQAALEQIQADIGGNYGGADGAGKVGYTPSEGVDEDTVQEAIEAVQANLTAYIAKIKAATGAAEVGNAPIVGMTATNVQQALEELRKNIDNIVSGIIPGGSITSDMLQDGAVTADKLGSDVTGDTIPTSASDPTSISSQLSNKVSYIGPPLDNVAIATRITASLFGFNNTCPDDPYGGSSGVGITIPGWGNGVWGTQIVFDYNGRAPFFRTFSSFGQSVGDWIKLATATPPEGYNLPLSDGISVQDGLSAVYSKNQFGEVVVHGDLVGQMQNGSVIATLPAGFRPIYTLEMPATCDFTAGRIQVNSAGEIRVISKLSECSSLCFLAVFVAGG